MNLNITNSFRKIYLKFSSKAYRLVIAYGGSRSGKTFAILQILLLVMFERKNIKITVWRNTRVTCRDTAMEDFRKIIESDDNISKLFIENKSRGSFTHLKTKSKIIFEGADQIGKVLGSAQDISYFNEVTEFNEDVYKQITQRTSETILCDYNPSKNFWLEKFKSREDTIFIHSDYTDNYMCPAPIVDQLNSYNPWEPGSYEVKDMNIYVNGKIMSKYNRPKPNLTNIKNGTADEYMYLVYGIGLKAEKPNKIYKGWKTISLNDYNKLPYESYYGLDFGIANPTAMVEVKFDGDETFYIKEAVYQPAGSSKNIPDLLKGKIAVKQSSLIVCDSAKQHYVDMINNAGYFAIGAIKGADSVSVGISLVQSFKIVYVVSDGLENEYSTYSFTLDRYGLSTDTPIKRDDHLMDALRYIITYLYTYLGIQLK